MLPIFVLFPPQNTTTRSLAIGGYATVCASSFGVIVLNAILVVAILHPRHGSDLRTPTYVLLALMSFYQIIGGLSEGCNNCAVAFYGYRPAIANHFSVCLLLIVIGPLLEPMVSFRGAGQVVFTGEPMELLGECDPMMPLGEPWRTSGEERSKLHLQEPPACCTEGGH